MLLTYLYKTLLYLFSEEDKDNIRNAIDKVAINLAKTGGMIEGAAGVKMYGIPANSLKKRSGEKSNYLAENGVSQAMFEDTFLKADE